MIKYLGTIGSFIRLNDTQDTTYQLLNVFSSSAVNELLFSASVNNSTGELKYTSGSYQSYVNGESSSVIPLQQWAHVTFSFPDKLATQDTNNFSIQFGGTGSSNFNIQNTYILEQFLSGEDIRYLHHEFTGANNQVIRVNDSASYSIGIVDAPEEKFISASTGTIYQPLADQLKYLDDIVAVEEDSLSRFISASIMVNDDLWIDGYNILVGDRILSYADKEIYQLTASSQLLPISSSVGDFVRILYGQYYGNTSFLKTNAGFVLTQTKPKVTIYVNRIQTNNT